MSINSLCLKCANGRSNSFAQNVGVTSHFSSKVSMSSRTLLDSRMISQPPAPTLPAR